MIQGVAWDLNSTPSGPIARLRPAVGLETCHTLGASNRDQTLHPVPHSVQKSNNTMAPSEWPARPQLQLGQ